MAEDEPILRDEEKLIGEDEEKLRRYLLGLSPPKESGEVERAILVGDVGATLNVIEDELVEDYVTGELSESDRSHFEERLRLGQETIEKIRVSAMLLGRPDVIDRLSQTARNLQQRQMTVEADSTLGKDPAGARLQFQSFDEPYVERLRAGDLRTHEHFMAYFGELIELKLRSHLHSPQAIADVRGKTLARVLAAVREGKLRQPRRLASFVNETCNNILLEHYPVLRGHSLEGEGSPTVPEAFSRTLGAPQREGKIGETRSPTFPITFSEADGATQQGKDLGETPKHFPEVRRNKIPLALSHASFWAPLAVVVVAVGFLFVHEKHRIQEENKKHIIEQHLALNPVPSITSISKPMITEEARIGVLTVIGSNFGRNSKVELDGIPTHSEFVSTSELRVEILLSTFDYVLRVGYGEVVVINPPPGGGPSAPMKVKFLLR
jgi:hypothetical protein